MDTAEHEMSPMKMPEATPEHRWLLQLVGKWETEGESMGSTSTWTETIRTIGDIWIQCESTGEMDPGVTGTAIMTIGFDPLKKRFWGSWIGSMMNHHWVYDGELDADQKALTLYSEGPSFTEKGKFAMYKDVIELESPTVRTLKAYHQTPDGNWNHFMTTKYVRVS